MAKFCGKCGSKLDEETGLCPKCDNNEKESRGHIELQQLNRVPKKTNKKKLYLCFFVVAVLLIVGIGSGTFLWIHFGDIQSANGLAESNSEFSVISGEAIPESIGSVEEAVSVLAELGPEMGYQNALSELEPVYTQNVMNMTTYRLQQCFEGVPVYGNSVSLISNSSGNVDLFVSNCEDIDFKKIANEILITKNDALKAVEQMGGLSDVSDVDENNDETLVLFPTKDGYSYAYSFCIPVDDNGGGTTEYYVDAGDGTVLANFSTVYNADESVIYSQDGYTVNIMESNGTSSLVDLSRGIYIFDWDGQNGEKKTSRRKLVTCPSGQTFDTEAVRFLSVLSSSYDYFYDNYSDSGFGTLIACYNDSADWGSNASGGTINTDYGYMTVGEKTGTSDLDVIGHEYTHIISKHLLNPESGNSESGAINEGLADLYGSILEAYISEGTNADISDLEPDWIMQGDNIDVYRNAIDPSDSGNATTVQDKKGFFTRGDKYYFATIIPRAAYLMWNGIDGNESKKLDTKTLSDLWYISMTMFPSDIDFESCGNVVESVAALLNSRRVLSDAQLSCVDEAFLQVGITGRTDISDYAKQLAHAQEKVDEVSDRFNQSENSNEITMESLTEGYWECMIQSHKVFKFNDDGTMEEYDCEPGVTPTEQNISYWKTHQYTWDGQQLVITWDDGDQTILELVTTDDDIDWDNGLRNQLSEIPDGEEFFYETEWEHSGAPSENAMYLVKVKDAMNNTSSLLEKIDTDLVLKGLANIGTGDSQVVYTDQLTTEDWQSIASMWLGNAYWAYQDESDEDPTPIREEDFISTDEYRAYFAQDALNTPIQLFGGDPEEVLDALCSYSPRDDYDADQIRIEGGELVWTLPGRGYAVIRNLQLNEIEENSGKVQIYYSYQLEDVGGWGSTYEGTATLVESDNTLGYRIESYGGALEMDTAQSPSYGLSSDLSGTIGQLYWSLSVDGTLEISGEGSMEFTSDIPPWESAKIHIKDVILTDGITSIDDRAFSGCAHLETISIPSTVTYIGEEAFKDCSNLLDLELPDGLITIGFMAFSGCSSLTEISIPSTVQFLEPGAFQSCSSLETVNLSEGLEILYGFTFGDCVKLTDITIPTSMIDIDWSAFISCFSLSDVNYAGSKDQWNQIHISSSSIGYDDESVQMENALLYQGKKKFNVSYSLWDGPISYGDGSSHLATYVFKEGGKWKYVGPTIHFESEK